MRKKFIDTDVEGKNLIIVKQTLFFFNRQTLLVKLKYRSFGNIRN
jgi:hypothetical protein